MATEKTPTKRRKKFSKGKQTHIAKSASLLGNGKIGDRCYIDENVIIGQPSSDDIREHLEKKTGLPRNTTEVTIGNDVIIQPNAIISGGVKIGNGVTIGPFVTVGKDTTIGDGTELMYHSQIYQKVKVGKNCIIAGFLCDCAHIGDNAIVCGSLVHDFIDGYNRDQEITELENKSPTIENDVTICTGAIIIGKIRIKSKTFVAAGAIVTKDTDGDCVIKGINGTTCIRAYKGRLRNSEFFKNSRGSCFHDENH